MNIAAEKARLTRERDHAQEVGDINELERYERRSTGKAYSGYHFQQHSFLGLSLQEHREEFEDLMSVQCCMSERCWLGRTCMLAFGGVIHAAVYHSVSLECRCCQLSKFESKACMQISHCACSVVIWVHEQLHVSAVACISRHCCLLCLALLRLSLAGPKLNCHTWNTGRPVLSGMLTSRALA